MLTLVRWRGFSPHKPSKRRNTPCQLTATVSSNYLYSQVFYVYGGHILRPQLDGLSCCGDRNLLTVIHQKMMHSYSVAHNSPPVTRGTDFFRHGALYFHSECGLCGHFLLSLSALKPILSTGLSCYTTWQNAELHKFMCIFHLMCRYIYLLT